MSTRLRHLRAPAPHSHVRAAPASRAMAVAFCATLAIGASFRFLSLQSDKTHAPYPALPREVPVPPSLAIISLYFGGTLPWYTNYWIESCGTQHAGIDCIVVLVTGITNAPGLTMHPSPESFFACREPADALPANVFVLQITGSDFRDLFERETGFPLHELANEFDFRKMAEFKPLYGCLLMHRTWALLRRNYTHWGWSDVDQVLGDVWSFTGGLGSEAVSSGGAAAAPVPDLWTWYFEGGWAPPLIAGQLGVARNVPAVLNIWRHAGPGLAAIFRSPDYKEFDEREFGAVVFALASAPPPPPPAAATGLSGSPRPAAALSAPAQQAEGGSSSPPASPAGFIDDAGVRRPLRVSAVLNGAFSDMLAVCGGDGLRWRYWWERGRVWGAQCLRGANESGGIGSAPGGSPFSAAPREGAYFHFMCAKWSRAMWEPIGSTCDAHRGAPWHKPRWNMTFSADPVAMAFRPAAAAAAAAAATAGDAPGTRSRRLFAHVPDDAVVTFHDVHWSARPQLGCPS